MAPVSTHILGSHAVVIGGSIAGLVCARVLSEHFDKVTVIERDARPEQPEPRKSAPQMRHAHLLLGAANATLEQIYPGVIAELVKAGALLLDPAADSAIYHYGGWKPRFKAGFHMLGCSRPFLEWHLRQRTEASTNIEIKYQHVVENLKTNAARNRVLGVFVKGTEGESTLDADLVVDTSGRGTRAPKWLESLGYERPFEQEVKVDLAYTSRIYERPQDFAGDWRAIAIYSRLPAQRGAFIFEIEGGRWLVSFPGYFKDHCPTDEEGFLAFAQSLPVSDIHDAIRNAKALTDPVVHKIPSSRWFRYDKIKRLPDGLIAIGDAVCSLNPLYGQGMMITIHCAKALGEVLTQRANQGQGLIGLPLVVQRKLVEVILPAWMLSTTMDLRFPQAIGARPFGIGAAQRIFANLIDLTSVNEGACRVFYDMLHMRRGPEAILDPRMLLPLLTYSVKSPFVPLEQRINSGPIPRAP